MEIWRKYVQSIFVHSYLLDPYILGGLSVTVLALLMGNGHLKIFKSRHFSYKFRKKIRVDKYVPIDVKWSETRKKHDSKVL